MFNRDTKSEVTEMLYIEITLSTISTVIESYGRISTIKYSFYCRVNTWDNSPSIYLYLVTKLSFLKALLFCIINYIMDTRIIFHRIQI